MRMEYGQHFLHNFKEFDAAMQYGPFVMNTQAEIQQAFADYRRTEFGGWPWDANDPVHPRDQGRFAKHADGKLEKR